MKKTLKILSIVISVLIILPYAKNYSPLIFGSPLIQIGSLVLSGILIGLSGVLSLHQWFARGSRIYFFGFLFLGVFQFGSIYGWYLLGHSVSAVLEEITDHSMMHVLAERAQDASQPVNRYEAAVQYYQAYGVELGYVDSNDALVRFSANESHRREREKWISIMKEQESTKSFLETTLHQARINLGLFPAMMSLGILAGAIGSAYLQPERKFQKSRDDNAEKPSDVERTQ